jgi:hypothetical protein
MPYATFSSPVNASVQTLWELLQDKIENPGRYVPGVEKSEILERSETGVLRLMSSKDMESKERITVDEKNLELTFALVDHPKYTGKVTNKITTSSDKDNEVILTFTLDWKPKQSGEEEPDMLPSIKGAVLHTKELAEQAEKNKNK